MASWSSKSKCGSILGRKTLSSTTPRSSATALSSATSLFKSVCLHDWWLIKPPEGKEGLAVSGFSYREGKNVRAFKSDVIARRHDASTLETVDGFRIALVGFVNKHLMHQNCFSAEVCSHFQFGFPYDWEEYTVKGSNEVLQNHSGDSAKHTFKTHSCNPKKGSQPESLDDLTRNQDPLMYNHRESDCHLQTMKAMDDLFECLSELEQNENLSSPGATCANLSDVMASDETHLINSNTANTDFLGNGLQSESSDDPPGPRNVDHTWVIPESGHVPIKRKISDMKVIDGSFPQETIHSDSATAKRIASAETTTVLKVDGKSWDASDKPAVRRRITRSMTKEKN